MRERERKTKLCLLFIHILPCPGTHAQLHHYTRILFRTPDVRSDIPIHLADCGKCVAHKIGLFHSYFFFIKFVGQASISFENYYRKVYRLSSRLTFYLIYITAFENFRPDCTENEIKMSEFYKFDIELELNRDRYYVSLPELIALVSSSLTQKHDFRIRLLLGTKKLLAPSFFLHRCPTIPAHQNPIIPQVALNNIMVNKYAWSECNPAENAAKWNN